GRIPRAARANEGDHPAGRNVQIDLLQDRPLRLVVEGDILEPYVALDRQVARSARAILDVWRRIEDLENPVYRSHRVLVDLVQLREARQRTIEVGDVGVELHQAP